LFGTYTVYALTITAVIPQLDKEQRTIYINKTEVYYLNITTAKCSFNKNIKNYSTTNLI